MTTKTGSTHRNRYAVSNIGTNVTAFMPYGVIFLKPYPFGNLQFLYNSSEIEEAHLLLHWAPEILTDNGSDRDALLYAVREVFTDSTVTQVGHSQIDTSILVSTISIVMPHRVKYPPSFVKGYSRKLSGALAWRVLSMIDADIRHVIANLKADALLEVIFKEDSIRKIHNINWLLEQGFLMAVDQKLNERTNAMSIISEVQARESWGETDRTFLFKVLRPEFVNSFFSASKDEFVNLFGAILEGARVLDITNYNI